MGYFDGMDLEAFTAQFAGADSDAAGRALFGFVSHHQTILANRVREALEDVAEFAARVDALALAAGYADHDLARGCTRQIFRLLCVWQASMEMPRWSVLLSATPKPKPKASLIPRRSAKTAAGK